MSKIIIQNNTDMEDYEIVGLVSIHISKGMISTGRFGKQYCFAVGFDDYKYISYCERRESGTHKFTLSNYMKG